MAELKCYALVSLLGQVQTRLVLLNSLADKLGDQLQLLVSLVEFRLGLLFEDGLAQHMLPDSDVFSF